MVKDLQHLLQPLKIKSLELKNRLVMPPMGTGLGNPDGTVSEANLAYLRRRVQSGAALYISEVCAVHPWGSLGPGILSVHDDSFLPGLAKMVEVVHAGGAKIALQLHHAGRESLFQLKQGTAIGPSALPSYIYGMAPREMTREDIQEVILAFGAAAVRARTVGFDAVELHGAHGYLLGQFLSLHSNQRSDAYGGDMKNRARFIVECLQEVRRQVGDDFPVSLRISAEEAIKNGYTIADMQKMVPWFVEAGADIIHASFGTHGSPGSITQAPGEYPQGFNVGLARQIKEVVAVPVIGVGRFSDPRIMDEAIARGDADLIAVARQHLADPDFLNNALAGHPEETFACLACNQGCIERLIFEGQSVRCAINPETGQELDYPTLPAARSQRVWVIGGGPGGLTAASEAARLGHQVTLFEQQDQVGGQVRLAARAPYKAACGEWLDRLAARARKNGAVLKTGTRVTPEMIDTSDAEVIILASGGENDIPEIVGVNRPHVCSAWEVLAGAVQPGEHIMVIGGGLVGMETVDFLISQGATDISLVEKRRRSPVQIFTSHGYQLHTRVRQGGCQLFWGTEVNSIEPDRVILVQEKGTQAEVLVDQVILAVGTRPNRTLVAAIEKKGIPYYLVGDASQPRRILEAVDEGARAAWEMQLIL